MLLFPTAGIAWRLCRCLLIDAGCDVNQTHVSGYTALHTVVLHGGKASIVHALLRGGADPNIADRYGYTPCHFADTVEMLKLVLENGGDPRKKNDDHMLPLHHRELHDGNVEHLRPLYEAWTPHRLLPRWEVKAFPLYVDQCEGFRDGVFALLLSKEVGMEILEYVAEMQRREMWWPVIFDMVGYM